MASHRAGQRAATGSRPAASDLHEVLACERPRLVGLCATLTRDLAAAEDLAQEALYEAWKHRHSLRDPDRCAAWLSGIARNVCRRWQQREHRPAEQSMVEATGADEASYAEAADPLDALPDELNLEAELGRAELATLLDRALALLPPDTRTILVAHYIEQSAHAEIARRLGLSEGAVKVRLHRGKLTLRRLLLTDCAELAQAYGLSAPTDVGWDETRLWCTICGERRLLGRLTRDTAGGEFALHCPACFAARGLVIHHSDTRLLGSVTRYKPALDRILTWADVYFRAALPRGSAPCQRCGQPAALRVEDGAEVHSPFREMHVLRVICAACGLENLQSLAGLALATPDGRAFRRAHPRIRMLPEREVETFGRACVVSSYHSVTDGARLDVLSARDTFEVLPVHRTASA